VNLGFTLFNWTSITLICVWRSSKSSSFNFTSTNSELRMLTNSFIFSISSFSNVWVILSPLAMRFWLLLPELTACVLYESLIKF
jgi:hypothetical protein